MRDRGRRSKGRLQPSPSTREARRRPSCCGNSISRFCDASGTDEEGDRRDRFLPTCRSSPARRRQASPASIRATTSTRPAVAALPAPPRGAETPLDLLHEIRRGGLLFASLRARRMQVMTQQNVNLYGGTPAKDDGRPRVPRGCAALWLSTPFSACCGRPQGAVGDTRRAPARRRTRSAAAAPRMRRERPDEQLKSRASSHPTATRSSWSDEKRPK